MPRKKKVTKKPSEAQQREKLELKQLSEKELRRMSKNEEAKTVTVPLDAEVNAALDAIEQEMQQSFPGFTPSRSALARIAILRSKQATRSET